MENLGGLDIIIANAGWTKFAAWADLNSLTSDEWNKARPRSMRSLPY